MRLEIVSQNTIERPYSIAEIANENAIRHVMVTDDRGLILEWITIHEQTISAAGAQIHLWSENTEEDELVTTAHKVMPFNEETIQKLKEML